MVIAMTSVNARAKTPPRTASALLRLLAALFLVAGKI
jgi:hypothetical protein